MSQQVMTLEEGWERMEKGITKLKGILDGKLEAFNSAEYMLLYTTIYNLCARPPHDSSQQLYEKYRESFENYIQSTVLLFITEKSDEFLLRELVKRWDNHKLMVRWLSRFFCYLERFFTARRSLPSLQEAGWDCFRVKVYEEVKGKARDAVLVLIDKEREGGQIDRALMKNVIDMFVAMKFDDSENLTNYYEQDFEKYMLEATSAYYSRKASKWILEDSCPEYMLKSEECLKREKERLSYYLEPSTGPKLIDKVQHELLVVNCSQLLEKEHSGCLALIRDGKMEDLSRMYNLFREVEKGLDPVTALFKQHITAEGMVLVKQAEDAASTQAGSGGDVHIEKIVELHDRYMGYVQGCFQNHTQFHKALKEAFEVFCNKNVAGASSAEILSACCDNILKKGRSEQLSDETIEIKLEKVVNLLRYVSDKDLFAEFSRKQLARRLLFDRSASSESEKSFLTKLKHLCGAQFTSKMEGMVTDLVLARENQSGFGEYLGQNPKTHPGIDLSVTVLTTGFWPTYKSSELILPMEMVKGVEAFKQFYDQKSKHRKLTWIYSLGSCNVVGKFAQKPIEMIVSTYQAAILLLFNNSDRLSYSDIMAQSNMSPQDLGRLLHSLSCSKYQILNKEPDTKTISNTDIFEFNSKFTDKMRRIKIPLPPVDERKKVADDVDRVRPYAIDAAVVRIMKSRKVLGHQQLVLECVEQLKRMFKPDIKAIKKRIEDLINRDFLERDEENPNVFKYVA